MEDPKKKLKKLLEKSRSYAESINEMLAGKNETDPSDEFPFSRTPGFIKNGEMRDYQIRGLNWLIALHELNVNGLLADEMGLGKTLQTVALLGYLEAHKKLEAKYLIIVPLSTLHNWMGEINQWCPHLSAVCLSGPIADRREIKKSMFEERNNWFICMTTYEIFILEKSILKKFNWHYVIIDEAHRIKNDAARLTNCVRQLPSVHRLLLTGTPVQNYLRELWTLLNYLEPQLFDSVKDFRAWFSTDADLRDKQPIEQLKEVVQPLLLRRLKWEAESNLLPKKVIKVFVGMSQMQREWYRNILVKDIDAIINGANPQLLIAMLMRLRQCANHPYMLSGVEPGPPYTDGPHLVLNSEKMIVLDKLLPMLREQGSRVLIFSQFIIMLNILEDYLNYRQYSFLRLDGSTTLDQRHADMQEFNAPQSQIFAYLITTRAGGVGINLQTADVVIFYDSDWNPQIDLQAMDRAHRIGQKKQVRVFRLITEQSVEEKIVQCAERKLLLDNMILQNGQMDTESLKDKKFLLNILRFGANNVFSTPEALSMINENITSILARSEAMVKANRTRASSLTSKKMRSNLKDFHFASPRLLELLAQPQLAEVELMERDDLYAQCFISWTRRDLKAFIEATEKYGREDTEHIALSVPGKSYYEVLTYRNVFWSRFQELQGIDGFLRRLEAGEEILQQQRRCKMAIKQKVEMSRKPLRQMSINYENEKQSRFKYTKQEDRFLIYTLHNLGYEGGSKEVYQGLHRAVRCSIELPENSQIRQRSPQELQERCEQLIALIESEQRQAEDENQNPPKHLRI